MASKWEPYQQRIRELYIDQRQSLQAVMNVIKNEHGFSASKTEYERQLRRWGVRKSMRETHVKFLKQRLEKREQQNKLSEVYVRGILVPRLEIQKRASRCFITLPEKYKVERSRTPDELLVITPISELYMASIKARDLPWIYFQKQLQSIVNLGETINMPAQMLQVMILNAYPGNYALVTLEGGPCVLEETFYYLCSIMPVENDEDITNLLLQIVGGDIRNASLVFLKLTVYLLSNRLVNEKARMVLCDELLQWFQMGQNDLFLQAVLSIQMPTINAFAEAILSSTLEAEDRTIFKHFLESGISADIIVRDRETDSRCTPLQSAARRGNIGLVELLLNFNADINATNLSGPGTCQQTPLQIAAQTGNFEIVELLISKGAAVNTPNRRSSSALQNGIMARNTNITKLLLEVGADINAHFGVYGCPLECTVRTGAMDIFELLLMAGADIDCPIREYGNTPLQSAIMIKDDSLVKRLLELGADVNCSAPAVFGKTALQWAAENGDLELCRVLIEAGADINLNSRRITPLAAAVTSRNRQLVKYLLSHGANINLQRGTRTALELATEANNLEMVQLLLSAYADPCLDESIIFAAKVKNPALISAIMKAGGDISKTSSKDMFNRSALHHAIQEEDLEFVQFLLSLGARVDSSHLIAATQLANPSLIEIFLDAGANCNDYSDSTNEPLNPLQLAARIGRIDLVRYFLDAGADVNWPAREQLGRTALQAAVEFGDMEIIQLLIQQEADLNSPPAESNGVTALQAAVNRRNRHLVEHLLNHGALANDIPSTFYGSTSIQVAARNGDIDVIRLLVMHGANINCAAAFKFSFTALQAAAMYGHYHTVLYLLNLGADVNAPACQSDGCTALQAAAGEGYLRIAKVLIGAGAWVDAPGSKNCGRTALETAAKNGRIDMLKLLLNAGANITGTGRSQLKNAMQLATLEGHFAAARFLKYHQLC